MFYPDLSRLMPSGESVVARPKASRDYYGFRFSPEGTDYAFVTNEAGQVKVWLKESGRKTPRAILTRFTKTEDNPDVSFPLISWHPAGGILGMTSEIKGHCYYIPYDVEKRKWGKRLLVDVEKITSWCYSPDGRNILFSGFKNGQSDIFIYSIAARSFQNITSDFYDDYNPEYLSSDKIVFASNRVVDSIRLKDNFMEASGNRQYDLFMYDMKKNDNSLLRITGTPLADEFGVQKYNGQTLLYLSDESGVVNRYEAKIDSSVGRVDTAVHYIHHATTEPLTDQAYNIVEHSYNQATNTISDITLSKGLKNIRLNELNLLHRPGIEPSKFHKSIKAEKESAADGRFSSEPKENEEHGFFLAEDNVAESDSSEAENAVKNEFIIPVGMPYRVQYSIDQVITQADFSFLNTSYQQFEGGMSPIYLNTGFNALFMLGINDLFEDYRVTGGFRIGWNLNNYEFMLSYENLARRLDRQVTIYRQSVSSDVGNYVVKQNSNSLFYTLKYPFNKNSSLRLTLKGRFETNVMTSLNDQTLKTPDERHLWAGVKLEYIFDTSKELYTNLWRGTKLKVFAEYEQRLERNTLNLLVIGFDARRSFKLYRNMTLAMRLAGSTNVGSARLVYYMGGVDNWIGPKFDRGISVDQSKNYTYQTLATNMRGFKQNIRNGTSFMVLNTELRIPVVQLIAGRKFSSNILNSIQLNIFGDVGTAWTGLTPYSEENCLYTRYIDSGPIHAEVKRQVEPIVGGLGVGARISLFGYFLRFDYAWGIEDFKISNKKGMFMFSIGTDF
ncbi:MAG: hypothetical protein SPL42_08275, partial [Bacteroidales bacterium]|nr:hypothetical protein [Bacteroidales bacterium]